MCLSTRVPAGVFFVLLAVCSAQELTEQEAVRLFLTASPHTRELRAGVASVRARTSAYGLWPNPGAAFIHEGAGLAQYWQMEQQMPVSGRLGIMRKAGSATVRVAESRSSFALWELSSDVRSAFYTLLLSQERETGIGEGLVKLREIVRILREREKQGEGAAFDRLRAERELTELQTELVSARVLRAQSRSRLASFFSSETQPGDLQAKGKLRGSAITLPPVSELIARALEVRADYAAEQQQLETFRYEQQAARRRRIPEPVVFAGLKRAEVISGIAYGPVVGVSVPLPVFNRGQAEVARLRAESERGEARRRILEQRILTEVKGAYATLEMRRRIARVYEEELRSSGARLEGIARVAYEEGELGILELLDAYRVDHRSRLKSMELTGAAKLAEIELERVVGEPVLNKEVLP